MRRSPRAVLFLFLFLPAASAGCQDYEQRARALGREAHREAERVCPADDGGESVASAFAIDACRARACAAQCVKAGAASFQRICADVCAARGGCDHDEDCSPGLRCLAVAPVLRRCGKAEGDAGR